MIIKKTPSKWFLLIILGFIVLVESLYIIISVSKKQPITPPAAVFCTADAMLCPDGSSVGRVAPNCNFSPCPKAETPKPNNTSTWKTYTNTNFGFSVKYNPVFNPDEVTGSGQQLVSINFGLMKNNGFNIEISTGDIVGYYRNQIIDHVSEKIDKEERISVDGVSATKLTYKQVIVIEKFDVSKVIVNKNNHDYIITALSSDIDQILSTFKFTDSPSSLDPTVTWKTYKSDKYGISFKYPKEAKIMGDINSQLFTIISENQAVSFLASNNPNNYEASDFFLKIISPSNPDSIRDHVFFSDAKINGINFILFNQDASYFSQQSQPLNGYQVKSGSYIIGLNFNKGSESLINQILSTFKFTD